MIFYLSVLTQQAGLSALTPGLKGVTGRLDQLYVYLNIFDLNE